MSGLETDVQDASASNNPAEAQMLQQILAAVSQLSNQHANSLQQVEENKRTIAELRKVGSAPASGFSGMHTQGFPCKGAHHPLRSRPFCFT